jgi:hypothetical protein
MLAANPHLAGKEKTALSDGFFVMQRKLHLNFDVAASWQRQVHQRVDGLWSWLGYVDETLVYAHLELLAALLVHVRALDHSKGAAVGWQWDWTSDGSAGAQSSIYDLLGRLVNYFVVVCLQANTNALFLIFLWFCNHVGSLWRNLFRGDE